MQAIPFVKSGLARLEAEVVYREHTYLLRHDSLTTELLDPYSRAEASLVTTRQEASSDFS